MLEWGIEVEEYIVSVNPHNDRRTRVCVLLVTCMWAAALQEVTFINISNHTFKTSNRWPRIAPSISSFSSVLYERWSTCFIIWLKVHSLTKYLLFPLNVDTVQREAEGADGEPG